MMNNTKEFEDIFMEFELPFKKCMLLPEPLDRHAGNYKKWEEYARKQTPPGKGLIVCACIKTFFTKDESYLENALNLVEFSDKKSHANAIGVAGIVISSIGQKAKGVQMLRDALKIYSSSNLIIDLARELDEDEFRSESIDLCKTVLKDEPDNIKALRILTLIYLNLGNTEDARVNILHALKIDFKNKLSREVMGDVFFEEENYLSSVKEYRKAKSFFKFNPYVTYRLACSYYYLGKHKKSKKLALKIRNDVFEFDSFFRDNSIDIKKKLSEIISAKI